MIQKVWQLCQQLFTSLTQIKTENRLYTIPHCQTPNRAHANIHQFHVYIFYSVLYLACFCCYIVQGCGWHFLIGALKWWPCTYFHIWKWKCIIVHVVVSISAVNVGQWGSINTQLCPGNRSQHDLTVISRTQSGMQTQMQKLHVVPVTLVSNRKSLCVRENLEIQEEETHKTFHTYCAPVTVVYTLTCDPCNNLIYDGVMGSWWGWQECLHCMVFTLHGLKRGMGSGKRTTVFTHDPERAGTSRIPSGSEGFSSLSTGPSGLVTC